MPASEPLTLASWVAGARLILPPDAAPVALTALQLAGLDLGPVLPLQFATASQLRSERPELVLHRFTPTARSLVDEWAAHGQSTSLLDAVTVADRLMHLRLVSPASVAELRDHPRSAVRQAALLARPGAESVRETRMRLCLTLAGLPEPERQVEIYDANGFVGRFDMAYPEWKILIEYEGDQHRTDPDQWSRDIVRHERARALGYVVIRITADLFRDPWSQVLRVEKALAVAGYSGKAASRSALWAATFMPVKVQRRR
ncbi:MAG: hypothetical protein Q4G35_13790 [Propionibacteriaceae bacterium]|nr:hypothetical protein [Propionibacteriaceae bacterium]